MNGRSKGFSLVEVLVGVALLIVAACGITQAVGQLGRLQTHYVASGRLNSTIENIATDLQAALRYESPAALALRAGRVPSRFTVTQWEPDAPAAPVDCSSERLTDPNERLHLVCRDRSGVQVVRDIDLNPPQPFPGAIVTAAPEPTP